MKLILPFPPSVNHYWRHFRGRMVISREGRAFRQNVCALLAGGGAGGARRPPSDGRIALAMDAFPPDRRRRDLDNLLKSTQDSLAHAGAYEDDSQIDLLTVARCNPVPGGQIVVRIEPLPLRRCLLCGHPLPADESENSNDT